MLFRPEALKRMLRDGMGRSLSMRRRLAVYLIALVCTLAALIFLAFRMIGLATPIDRQIENTLSNQLDRTSSDILHDTYEMAAWGISFSDQLSDVVETALQKHHISFDGLRNNGDVLGEIQQEAYNLVYTHMQLTTCSGAFYLLDTTVNDTLPAAYLNGLYLKYANLYAENTINNKPCMFRGNSGVARKNRINLYSTWQLESAAGTFPQAEALLAAEDQNPARNYLLTEAYALPDSWERVRLICIPVVLSGRTIGVCGFEINDLFFRLVYSADSEDNDLLTCALLTEADGLWSGQCTGAIGPDREVFSVKPHGSFLQFDNGTEQFIGLMQEITVGESRHGVAVMMPMRQYEQIVGESRLKAAVLLLAVLLLLFAACIFISHRYANPILHGLAQLKISGADRQTTSIPEIADLFEFLAAKDRSHEAELEKLRMEKADVQREREQAKTALAHLQAAGIQEIDEEAYALFCRSLCTLTPKEREVFGLYLQGKNGREIQEALSINQNTLKYHNRNIYEKLGVSSRKELLKYAALMQERPEQYE